jgi:hypothetical protein
MTIQVAAGSALFANSIVNITAKTPTIGSADTVNPRVDLVSLHSDNTAVVTAGTPAANPATPALPSGNVPVAVVYVPANATAIGDHNIGDRRVVIVGTPQQIGLTPTAAPAALTDNSGGGAADGTIGAVTLPTLSAWNGSVDPTAAQATAINAALQALMDAVKELSTQSNAMRTALRSAGILT